MPALLPYRADWVRTKILSGPGARLNKNEAMAKVKMASGFISVEYFHGGLCCCTLPPYVHGMP